jgi:uncharacterized flavoprotein (TIGR03862 family)
VSRSVAVIGGGPAGLMAAEVLSAGGAEVAVYEKAPTFGRRLLMAGRGGLNLTHSEDAGAFLARYGAAAGRLRPMLEAFSPQALRDWADALGQETFVGSSGRVFPKALKASPLLRAWLARLAGQGVGLRTRHAWRGWNAEGALVFATEAGEIAVRADAVVLALGGASWPRLGADGGWAGLLAERGVEVAPFRPANMGVDVAWSELFQSRFAGQPLKGLALTFARRRVRGEAVVTRYGLEGGGVYALSSALRDAVAAEGRASLYLDLRPDQKEEALAARLRSAARPGQSLANTLRRAGLSPVEVGLLREAHGAALGDLRTLAAKIKGAPLTVTGVQGLARAISSAGGVTFDALGEGLELKALPGVFVAGEMLDWEAPTGGYLLQACFATGAAAGREALPAG